MCAALDFVAVDSNAAIKSKSSELACELDSMRSLKKTGIRLRTARRDFGASNRFSGQVNWQDVNSLVRPQVGATFTYQLISVGPRGCALFSAGGNRDRFGNFTAPVLPHNGRKDSRTYKEISQLGDEMKLLAPALKARGGGGCFASLRP